MLNDRDFCGYAAAADRCQLIRLLAVALLKRVTSTSNTAGIAANQRAVSYNG